MKLARLIIFPILFAVLFISCSNSETNELPEKIFSFLMFMANLKDNQQIINYVLEEIM